MQRNSKENQEKLTKIFIGEIEFSLKMLKGKNKHELVKYLPQLYFRWKNSTLVPDTFLTPEIIRRNGAPTRSKLSSGTDRFENIKNISLSTANRQSRVSIEFEERDYSLRKHPVLEDMRIVADFCDPIVRLDANREPIESRERLDALVSGLSIREAEYAGYLIRMCVACGVLEDAHSINVNAYRPSKKAEAFFGDPGAVKALFRATVDFFADEVLENMPAMKASFSEFLKRAIEEQYSTDVIYTEFFSDIGMDVNGLTDIDEAFEEAPDDMKEIMRMSFFFFGIAFDKYLMTPLSNYLKLIQPVYTIKMNLLEETAIIINSINAERENDTDMFSPCSFFLLTPLGLELFSKKTSAVNREFSFGRSIDVDNIVDEICENYLDYAKKRGKGSSEIARAHFADIYDLKVSFQSQPSLWFTMSVITDTLLAELASQISLTTDEVISENYRFYVGEQETPFNCYTPEASRQKVRKTESTQLDSLKLAEGSKIKFVTDAIPFPCLGVSEKDETRLIIEVKKLRKNQYALQYPKLERFSRAFERAMELKLGDAENV